MDIGQPKDYLTGQKMYLSSLKDKEDSRLSKQSGLIEGDVMVHSSAKVHETAVLGPNVVIGANCVVGAGARIQNSTIMSQTKINDYAYVEGSIIGWNNTVGKWCRINGLTVTAEDVQFKDEIFVNGALVAPHKGVAASVIQPGTIII